MFFECTPVEVHNYGLVLSLFLGGLFGGVTHCALMCAPFVFSLQAKQVGRLSSILLLPYHLGRMTTYVALGVCAHVFLSYAFPASPIRSGLSAALLTVAALLFWLQALPALGKYMPFLLNIHIPAPLYRIQACAQTILDKPTAARLYVTGILLGFIPCGLVMGALLAASTATTPLQAAVAMAAFAAGTIPSLIGVAVFGKSLATLLPRGIVSRDLLFRGVLVINGCVLLLLAGQALTGL